MKPIIVLEADGVLLDCHYACAQAWAKAFGTMPGLRDPFAYWSIDRWEVSRLAGDELAQFRACFDVVTAQRRGSTPARHSAGEGW